MVNCSALCFCEKHFVASFVEQRADNFGGVQLDSREMSGQFHQLCLYFLRQAALDQLRVALKQPVFGFMVALQVVFETDVV